MEAVDRVNLVSDTKEARKVFSRLGWCYIAGTVAVYLLQIVISYVLVRYHPEWLMSTDAQIILSSVIVYGIGMPLIAFLAKGIKKQELVRHKMRWWQFLLAFMMCYAIVFISNLIGIAMTSFIGDLKGSAVENNVTEVISSGSLLINFVSMVILAPILEEYVFRKLIVDRTARYGQGVAVLASGLMFGLFHGNLNQFAYAVTLGCFFAFLYLRTGNIKITIVLHAIINFMGGIVAGNLMELVQYDELMALNPNDEQAAMNLISENIIGWLVLSGYVVFLLVVVLVGFIFLLLSIKKMKAIPQETDLPKGQRMKALFVNPGMIVFCLIWIALIVLQLFV